MATATVSKWTPFGVALDLTAGNITITRKSASQFTVHLSVSWATTWEGAQTDYGMDVTSGGVTKTISTEGTKRSSGSGSLTGTYSITTNGAATVPITIKFKNYNTWAEKSATKSLTLNISVPAWTSYMVKYSLNGGSGTFGNQTKWKDQALKLHSHSPTKTGYSFQGWRASNGVLYKSGASYTANSATTLTAEWKANTYTVTYNANGGSGAPGTQTKTYGVDLSLSTTKPTRTNYNFKGWGTSATTNTVTYQSGSTYKSNANVVLYAVWELAYVRPKISELTITRGDNNPETGVWESKDDGTTALVRFKWSTFIDVVSITISCESANNKLDPVTVSASGTSGEVEQLIGSGSLNADSTYTVKVAVADGDSAAYTSSLTRTLPGTKFVIDFLAGGKGAAIGKPAENENLFDIAFQTKLAGGLAYPILPPGTDLNDIRTPNLYIGENVSTYEYVNCPIASGTFTLEVLSSGSNGQVKQIFTQCDKTKGYTYERTYYGGDWQKDDQSQYFWYGAWYNGDLSVAGNFTNYYSSGSEAPKYRRVGDLVEIRGTVKPLKEIEYSTDYTTIFTLPPGYRPDTSVFTLCQGSGHCLWLLQVNNEGRVGLTRYRTGDTSTTVPTTAWLPFHCTFLVG